MIGYLRPRVSNLPIIALYFESETVLKFYNLEAWGLYFVYWGLLRQKISSQKEIQFYFETFNL